MTRVVCFGEALIDFAPVSAPSGAPPLFAQHAGGAPANVAVAVAKLGGRSEFAGALATDAFGDFLLRSLRDAGVGLRLVQRTGEAPTALAFVTLDAHGERSFGFYRPPAADLLYRADEVPDEAFGPRAILHACSNSLTEAGSAATTLVLMRRARDSGALVSFDMNLRPALWPDEVEPDDRVWRALELADVIKLSAEELAFLLRRGSEASRVRALLFSSGCRLLVVTDGARPLRWYTASGQGTLESFRVKPIDSTAAGDAFSGGLLHALASRRIDRASLAAFCDDVVQLRDALRFASACGALATTRPGAFAAMPSRDEVERLMREGQDLRNAGAA